MEMKCEKREKNKKKFNQGRHSQRCDMDLKLSVRFISISDNVITTFPVINVTIHLFGAKNTDI